MNTLGQDIYYGTRMLFKRPGFTVVALLTLALGIGMNTALFSVVKAVLLRPLPFEDPDRLVLIYGSNLQKALTQSEIAPADFVDYREQNRSFQNVSALRYRDFTLTGVDEPQLIRGAMVSANFFSLLGARPFLGRVFLTDEDQPGKDRVAVISYGLWQRRFGSDPSIIDKPLTLNGESFIVSGILPPEFDFPRASEQVSSPDLWIPLTFTADDLRNRRNHVLLIVARLNPGIILTRAQADLSVIADGLEQQYPQSNSGWNVKAVLLNEQFVVNTRPALLVLLGAVALVLFIACANVANLSLVRAASRQKEIALRIALGASRVRIIRQLLTESVLLATIGGVLGVVLALWAVKVLTNLKPDYIPRMNDVGIDSWVLGFTLAVSLLTGVVFGLAPALQASKPDVNDTLKEGGKSPTSGSGRNRTGLVFVVSEIALALVLLISAGLLIRSFTRLLSVNPGFNGNNLATMEINLPRSKYGKPQQQSAFFEQLIQRVAGLPGIESVGGTNHLPLGGSNSSVSFTVEGRPLPGPGEATPTTNWRAVTPDYFKTMQIPLLDGRSFNEWDKDGAPIVVVISKTMANLYWPDEDPMDQRIRLGGTAEGASIASIVGVVGDVRHWGLDSDIKSQIYLSYLQDPPSRMTIVARGEADPTSLASSMRSQVFALDKDQPVANVNTMEQVLAHSVSRRGFTMTLLTMFAVVALVLAVVGIYGVISYSVSQRRHEIGVRLALGAQKASILKMIIGQGMRIALLGVVIGIGGAIAATRLLSSLLYGTSATDFTTFLSIPLVIILVTFLASYFPAWRATKVDPMIVIRNE